MDLDQAMLLLAQRVPEPDGPLLERVRADMLRALAGGVLSVLSAAEAARLQEWLQGEFGADTDPAGALYQAMLGRVIARTRSGELEVRRERRAHRATGAYYTKDVVVRYMMRRVAQYLPAAATVIDPACGSGAFLEGVHRAFGDQINRLAGLDADPLALVMCRENVPGADLHQADALLDDVPGGYDLCIGNPPYISSGLRGAAPQDLARQRLLAERYPLTAEYKLNTYPLFVERGLQLVREGGVLGYILPDSFLSGRYFSGLRRLLLENTLLELTLVCEDFWKHGRVGQSVILFVRRGPAPPGHQVLIRVCRQVAELEQGAATPVTLAELAFGPLQRFRLIPDPKDRTVVQRMESVPGSRPLGDLFRSYSGLIGRDGQRSLLRSVHPELPGPWGRLLRSGREIDRYTLAWQGEEVCLAPDRIKSGGHFPYYQGPKLLLRQTSDCLRAVYDDQGFYCLNNIHLLVPQQSGLPVRAFLGLINADAVNRYYRALTMETGRLYAQVDLDLLESIPIPLLCEETVRSLELLVRKRENAASYEAAQIEQAINRWVERAYGLG